MIDDPTRDPDSIRIQSGLIVLVSILQIALLARERNIRPAVSPDPVKQPANVEETPSDAAPEGTVQEASKK